MRGPPFKSLNPKSVTTVISENKHSETEYYEIANGLNVFGQYCNLDGFQGYFGSQYNIYNKHKIKQIYHEF